MRTISRMYDNYADAAAVVADLEAANVPHDDITLVANADAQGRAQATDDTHTTATDSGTGATRGAVTGGVVGGAAGLLAGIGAIAIPGIGPLVAAGWLAATLAGLAVGAGGGGLIGALTGAGVSHEEAHVYAEGVKRGASLVSIRADETQVPRIESIMDRRPTTDWRERRKSYGPDWKSFDETTTGTAGTAGAVYPDAQTTTTTATNATEAERLRKRGL
jgi:hypothetical protein